MSNPQVLVVGGGIVGLATAYTLLRRHPGIDVTVCEKEAAPGKHQSGRNSGVLHAGLYYAPGSSKALLAVRGIRSMTRFCETHGIAHEVVGKLVVAADETERPRLDELLRRGTANGLRGLRLLDIDAARDIEPNVGGVAAVHVPEEGIVDYGAVCATLVREISRLGGEVRLSCRVELLRREVNAWHAQTNSGPIEARLIVNCAGLHSDRVLESSGESRSARIVPFRGEYYELRADRQDLVRNLIYPVPDPSFPFLGVHFTRMIHGGVECGPNAVLALKREGYSKKDLSLRDAADALLFPGLWRFIARYPRMTWYELRRAFSRELFAAALQRLVPAVQADDLIPARAGVRAQAMKPDGTFVQDFLIVERPGALHVVNAPSPGATASLAIGEEIVMRAERNFL